MISQLAEQVAVKPAYERKMTHPTDNGAPSNGPVPEVPDSTIKDLVQLFKLLSDETRLKVLFSLAQTEEMHVRALCELLGQSQPAVSHHLALLRVAGLIEPRREGKHNFYRILPDRFQHLLDLFFQAVPGNTRRIRFEDYVLMYAPAEELDSISAR